MQGVIPAIIDGGESNIGIESTVIDLSTDEPTILRPGFYTYEFLKEILDDMRLDDSLIDSTKIPKSPGQKYKHYAPKANLRVFIGKDVPDYLLTLAKNMNQKVKK